MYRIVVEWQQKSQEQGGNMRKTFDSKIDALGEAHKLVRDTGKWQYAIEWPRMGYWTVEIRKPSLRCGQVIEVTAEHAERLA